MAKAYPEDQMIYSWKKLMQNHPHDSICGCSVDEVNEEMKTRFAKSRQVADAIYDESVEYLTDQGEYRGTSWKQRKDSVRGMEYFRRPTKSQVSSKRSCICSAITICLYGMVMRRRRR